jgi:hypothetical protein
MSIYVSNTADLLAMINVATGQTFVAADLVFGTARATTPAEITKYGKNSVVAVNSSPTSTKTIGFTTIFYDRLQLDPLQYINLTNCICPDGANLVGWLPVVVGHLGIPFTTTDLVEHTSTTVNGKVNVQLEAKPGSLGWLGSVTLKFGGYADITTAFNGDTLIGF